MEKSRYSQLRMNDELKAFPKVKIDKRSTDLYMTYNPQVTRLDRIAANVYGDDTLYWLIMIANPQYYMEFDIPPKSVIRVPMPLNEVMKEFYSKQLKNLVT